MRSANGGILAPQLTTGQRDALAIDNESKGLLIYNTDTNQYNYHNGTLWLPISTTSTTLMDADGDTNIYVEQSGDEDSIRFFTDGTERMVIRNNGNIGIGTATPDDVGVHIKKANPLYLEIDNGMFLRMRSGGGNWAIMEQDNTSGTLTIKPRDEEWSYIANAVFSFRRNGRIGIGTINPTQKSSVNGHANKTGGATWGSFSDLRIKKEIMDYTTGLDAILKIRPVSFQYNEKSPFNNLEEGKPMVGIIAQEMQKILPNTISKTKTGAFEDLLSYNANELTYTLVNAVKELNAKNEALTAENKALKTAVAAIEKRLEKLEK